jgi:hypothetical protein
LDGEENQAAAEQGWRPADGLLIAGWLGLQPDRRRANLGVRASATRRASRGAGAVGRRPWGRGALPHGARHRIEDREKREKWGRERLTDGPHLAVTEVKVVGGRQASGLKG